MNTFKNTTDAPKGINTKAGTVYVNPGATSRALDVSDAELKSMERTEWWEISSAKGDEEAQEPIKRPEDGSEANDTASREGGPLGGQERPAPGSAEAMAQAALTGGIGAGVTADQINAMGEDELRQYLTDRDGKAPHVNAKEDTLREKALEGLSSGETV